MKSTKHIVILWTFICAFASSQPCSTVITDTNNNENAEVDCDYPLDSNGCIDLSVSYEEIHSTTSYDVQPISFNPVIPFNQGTPMNATFDDLFSPLIDLPFTFCFYDKSYDSIVIGSNGIITFDENQASAECPPSISGILPNPSLVRNSIFAIQHDLIFSSSDESEIYTSVIGEAPCRQFVINYYQAKHFGCAERSTVQVVLSELTNQIDVYVESKPLSCANGRSQDALLGIMNASGLLGYAPPNRNTGIWEANNEAWQFNPLGTSNVSVVWKNSNGNQIGTGESITVCPIDDTQYIAEVIYSNCDGSSEKFSDEFNVEYADSFPKANDIEVIICDVGNDGTETVDLDEYRSDVTPNPVSNFIFNYYNTLTNAETGGALGKLSSPITISSNTTIYCRVENKDDASCFDIAKITLIFGSVELLTYNVELCDTNNVGQITNYQLSKLNTTLFATLMVVIKYYNTNTDATLDQSQITNKTLVDGTQLWVRYEVADDCYTVYGPITIAFLGAPTIVNGLSESITLCDVNWDQNEDFDWVANYGSIVTTDPSAESIAFYSSYGLAESGGTPLTKIRDGDYSVYFRVNGSDCYSIGELKMSVTFTGVDAKEYTDNICFDGTEDKTIKLDDYVQYMLNTPTVGELSSITFHTSEEAANNDTGSISSTQNITNDGRLISNTYWVRLEISDDCYTVRKLTIRLVHPEPASDSLDLCDINNNQTQTINLSSFNSEILGGLNATIKYYLTENEAIGDTGNITSYTFTTDTTLYVQLSMYGCVEIYPIYFKLMPSPEVNDVAYTVEQICDNNADGVEEFDITQYEADIYTGTQLVNFTYYKNYNPNTEQLSNVISNPTQHETNMEETIYVKVAFDSSGCYSVAEIKLTFNYLPIIELQAGDLFECDFELDLNETFNLNEAAENMFIASSSTSFSDLDVTFHESINNALNAVNPISNPEAYIPTTANYNVYVRFESQNTGCYSTEVLTLHTIFPPKVVSAEIEVCDTNLNGVYDLDLTTINPLVIENAGDYQISYYLSESDAINKSGELSPIDFYEANPFPNQIWVRVENIEDCFDVNYVNISQGSPTILDQNTFSIPPVCDDNNDGVQTFNLMQFETEISTNLLNISYYPTLTDLTNFTNEITNPAAYDNTTPYTQTIYVSATESGYCPSLATINLEVNPSPEIEIQNNYFCLGESTNVTAIVSNAGTNYVYQWEDSSGNILSITNSVEIGTTGEYVLQITGENGCITREIFNVEPADTPVIVDIVENGNNITVIATGSNAPLEYSIDGITWQTDDTFYDLAPGVYTFYAKYIDSDCKSLPAQGIIFGLTNVITPNNDGKNDQFIIDGINVFGNEECQFTVFNRYGKILYKQTDNNQIKWDGTYQGRKLPSTDYWYIFTTPDGREFTGSITVKNE